jgi:hypothetical protein
MFETTEEAKRPTDDSATSARTQSQSELQNRRVEPPRLLIGAQRLSIVAQCTVALAHWLVVTVGKVWPITAVHSFDRFGRANQINSDSAAPPPSRSLGLCSPITGVVVASHDVCRSAVYAFVYCSIFNRSPFTLFPDSESVVDKSIPKFCLPYPTSCFVFRLPVTWPSAIQVDFIYFPTIHSQGWHRYASTSVLGSIRSDNLSSSNILGLHRPVPSFWSSNQCGSDRFR